MGPTLIAGAATLLGLALRINDLARIGLCTDEGHSVWLASQPLRDLAALVLADSAPPLYFAILSGWQALFPTDAGLRALSVLLGTAAIPLVFMIGRELAGERLGAAAACFMAVSNFHIEYSQMAKNYALFVFLTLLALWCFLEARRRPGGRLWWAAMGLAMAAMMYTHAVGPFMAAGITLFGLLWLGRGIRECWRGFAAAHVVAALLFLPWAGGAVGQARAVVKAFWAPMPTLTTPIDTFSALLLKPPFVPDPPRPKIPEERPGITSLPFMEGRIGDRPARGWLALPWAAFAACTLLAAIDPARRRLLALFALPLVPMAALVAISRLAGPIYLHRTLLPGVIVVSILLAAPFASGAAPRPGASRGAPAWLRQGAKWMAAGCFAVMLLTGWHFPEVRELPAWSEAASYVSASASPGDAIVYDGHFGQIIMERYLTGAAAGLPAFGLPNGWYEDATPTMGRWVTSDADLAPLREAAGRNGAIWFVRSHTRSHDPDDLGLKWCRAHLRETQRRPLPFIEVYRFEPGSASTAAGGAEGAPGGGVEGGAERGAEGGGEGALR